MSNQATARKQEIETPLGIRERLSCGEVMVPTYYGILRSGDKAELIRRGYKAADVRKAAGIRANGRLVVYCANGFYSEIPAPKVAAR